VATADTSASTASIPAPAVALAADQVSVRFGGVSALSDVSVAFAGGEVCGLIGPNGAGKTTLFDVLSGVRAPTAGRVVAAGVDVTRRSATWRSRRGIRRTFQRQQTFGWLTVEENLLVALEWRGGGGGLLADLVRLPPRVARESARRARAREVLELCGIGHLRDEPAGLLPIGRARIVELARAIVDRPSVVLLDEPTSGLEQAESAHLAECIRRVSGEDGTAVVLVEHDVRFVMELCARIVVLHLGEVIADGAPDDVRRDAAVSAAYLGGHT
jgi:branched-chain amino acid transport system ATP-binding protein